jgi:hypothetical protein
MTALIRTNATLVWLILSGLTVVSWALGTQHGLGGANHVPASVAILVVAVFKVRLVGLYFMELRDAPVALRALFEGYCVILLGLLVGMLLLG